MRNWRSMAPHHSKCVIKSSPRFGRMSALFASSETAVREETALRFPEGVIKSSRGFERMAETKWRTKRTPPESQQRIGTLKGCKK